MKRRVLRWLGNALIGTGVLLLVITLGLLGYSQYEERLASQDVASLVPPSTATARSASPTRAPIQTSTAIAAFVGSGIEGSTRAHPTNTVTPLSPSPTATPAPVLPAQRVVAPTIGLDTKVVESHIVNGEWQVPKFVAGHLEGTALPLQNGNVVLSGHVQSISSGNVFAKIGMLKIGDSVQLYTQAAVINYAVSFIEIVPNDDISVVLPTSQERLTLITCTGTFLPLQRDYDKRLVVVASPQM
jgi:LPXTG-site transpeptidase (sortase) family protein